jgi:transcriptional regulator with XRE-family HTH domain
MSQQDLAEAAGIEQAALSRIESNSVSPRAATLFKIRKAFDETRSNENFECRVHDLDDGTLTYYDQKFMPGRREIFTLIVKTARNAPELQIGDRAFLDAEQTDPSFEGYYLFRFPVDTGIYYSTQDIRKHDCVILSCNNRMVDNIGRTKKSDLEVLGRLIHVGRNY